MPLRVTSESRVTLESRVISESRVTLESRVNPEPRVTSESRAKAGESAHTSSKCKGIQGNVERELEMAKELLRSHRNGRCEAVGAAMKKEYESIMKNKTWTLVPHPKNAKVVRSRWVLPHKR